MDADGDIVCTVDAIAKDNTELVFDRDCCHVRRRYFSRLCSAVCLSFLCLGLGSPVSHVTDRDDEYDKMPRPTVIQPLRILTNNASAAYDWRADRQRR